ncbi:hypothetical protein [Levilactobacillus mulengensis]|nr:hypothetical protein [Levilactobacillus mulengensis]
MAGKQTGAIVATAYYAVILLLVAFHLDMLAMWGMAVGMLVDAGMRLVQR